MIDPTELVKILFQLSGTFAALCIPAVSVAYFIVAQGGKKVSTITLGALTGIIFVISTMCSFVLIVFNLCEHWWIVGLLFVIGCLLIILVFLTLAGVEVRRKIPPIGPKKTGAEQ